MEREQFLRSNVEHLGIAYKNAKNAEKQYDEFLGGLPTFDTVYELEKLLKGRSMEPDSVSRFTKSVVTVRSNRAPIADEEGSPLLYPPQAAMVSAMLRHEANSWSLCPNLSNRFAPVPGQPRYTAIQCNMGRIVERFSFGKTHLVSHLVNYQPVPEWRCYDKGRVFRIGARHPADASSCVETNLVIVGRLNVKDWKDKCFTVSTAKSLTALRQQYERDGRLPRLVAVRAGEMSFADRHSAVTSKASVLSWFLQWFGHLTFARVFYDDYDCLGLFDSTKVPDALFHWLISSTDQVPAKWTMSADGGSVDNTVGSFDRANRLGWLYTAVRCNRDFAAIEFKLPAIEWLRYDPPDEDAESNASCYVDCVRQILAGRKFPAVDNEESYGIIFNSKRNCIEGKQVTPSEAGSPRKILVVLMDEDFFKDTLAAMLEAFGAEHVIKLDRRNAHTFDQKPQQIAVSKPLHGINMGYLTDIVICDYDCPESIEQTVGRGQRLGRTASLRAYVC